MPTERKGELYAISNTLIWGTFPVLTVLSYASIPPLTSLAWSTFFGALFFAILVTRRRLWHELKEPLLWRYIAMVILFLSVGFYTFYFLGLTTTTPGNAAIILLLEVATSFIFFHLIRRDPISLEHRVGALLMVLGAVIILIPNYTGIRVGDLFIIAAVCVAPIGNLFQQKARMLASTEVVMFMRTAFALPFLFAMAYLTNAHASLHELRVALPILLLNGIVIIGISKIFWIEAIHRISVTKAAAFESFAPLVTLACAWALLGQQPNLLQLLSLPPFVVGTLFITEQLKLKTRTS